ncbi:MAG TPA: helix-turn-helix domain-containing protein [Mycobacteriales bacterium]|nr:helix-turn-helix domain-containing protein [Mycobacteriales bacterium]
MASPAPTPARRQLAGRQADTAGALVDAAVVEIAETGFEGLTLRNVARRAGVSPATAYSYFSSKNHLLAEVFWRRLSALEPPPVDRRRSVSERVGETVRGMALLVADEPELAAGITTAMLAHDADVKLLRDRIGALFVDRLARALGRDATPTLVRALTLTFTGAMLTAGMGNLRYDDLPALLVDAAELMTGRKR